ncbi:hypothetical protein [Phocaeicola vulgatus]|uniref:Uncharacterized protein n=2 Tax=Phocaeicola TaxID=909656 RepID=A0A069S8D6_PHOVU|nr:hypothetical protein [Phocaeicola vulgatus]EEB25897.1 hypothetical protein BACDOR_01621 [Phocaeicola dorei DSM 17855]KDS46131.1 hypothetical protein M099_3719 [Phocaeicola vulgatus str. 3975 RP4]MBV3468564.1 hypothetical protein [Phocaeicola vulgatus]MBV3512091.1 hypothetical protein [Phocaeicola vulgatus]MBV3524499.1 hypothetical protein [Phocaeicola vulgatus]
MLLEELVSNILGISLLSELDDLLWDNTFRSNIYTLNATSFSYMKR